MCRPNFVFRKFQRLAFQISNSEFNFFRMQILNSIPNSNSIPNQSNSIPINLESIKFNSEFNSNSASHFKFRIRKFQYLAFQISNSISNFEFCSCIISNCMTISNITSVVYLNFEFRLTIQISNSQVTAPCISIFEFLF